MSTAVVAFGSNLGETGENIDSALRLLGDVNGVRILRVSSILKTYPVGPMKQGVFSNGVLLLETSLAPFELLRELQDIENELRRVRTNFWGPRTIDLDLIFFDDLVLWTSNLTIPHPRVYWRNFVLDPLCEIAPDLVIPTSGLTCSETKRLLDWNFQNFPIFSFCINNSLEFVELYSQTAS